MNIKKRVEILETRLNIQAKLLEAVCDELGLQIKYYETLEETSVYVMDKGFIKEIHERINAIVEKMGMRFHRVTPELILKEVENDK